MIQSIRDLSITKQWKFFARVFSKEGSIFAKVFSKEGSIFAKEFKKYAIRICQASQKKKVMK